MNRLLHASVLLTAVVAAACDAARGPGVARPSEVGIVASARVDTIRGRLDNDSYAGVQGASPAAGRAVLLVLYGDDVRTCEDLSRQARELQRWAVSRGARLLIWSAGDSSLPVTTFLRREKIGAASIIRSDSLPHLQDSAPIATPAALLVEPGGAVLGTAHPDRVPNVRIRSFADELEELLRAQATSGFWRAGSESPRGNHVTSHQQPNRGSGRPRLRAPPRVTAPGRQRRHSGPGPSTVFQVHHRAVGRMQHLLQPVLRRGLQVLRRDHPPDLRSG
jgi:hypothetical protein